MNEVDAEEEKPRLYVYEWAAVLFIGGFLLMICILTHCSAQREASKERASHNQAQILIPVRIMEL